MITLGLSRIDYARLRQPKITVRHISFDAVGAVPFAESVLMCRMNVIVDIPSNVRCAAPMDARTAKRLRVALEGVLQAEELPVDRGVFVQDGRRTQG